MFEHVFAIRLLARHRALGTLLLSAMLTGCVSRQYELEMQPAAGQLKRKITVSAKQSTDTTIPLDTEELARIAAIYEADVPTGGGPKHSFVNTFSARTPDDLGGAGTFTEWQTSLGTTSAYLERVRGDDDIAGSLERRRNAVDRLVDLLIGWCETELADAPELSKVRQFLDESLRRDLINLGIYVEAIELVDVERLSQRKADPAREQGELEVVARTIQYCVERNYVTPEQLPEWDYAIDQANQQRPQLLVELVQRTVATKLSLAGEQPTPALLTRLSNPQTVDESFRNYLRETDEYRTLKAQWEQTPAEERGVDPPDPRDVARDLVAAALLPRGLLRGNDRLTATLATETEPMATNGQWNGDKRRIEWNMSIEGRRSDGDHGSLPKVLYALWAEPAVEAQTRHFGKVVLTDESLASYCLWQQGLPATKAQQWEAFLATLAPGPDLADRIRAFRFDDEPADAQTRSQAIRDLLADSVKPADEQATN